MCSCIIKGRASVVREAKVEEERAEAEVTGKWNGITTLQLH